MQDSPEETINVANLPCDKAILHKPDSHEHLILSEGAKVVHLDCEGDSLLDGPACFEFIQRGFLGVEQKHQTLQRLKSLVQNGVFRPTLFRPTPQFDRLLKNLVALDGWRNSEQQREIAIKIFGSETVKDQWAEGSDFLRSRVRRHIKRGIELMNGDYLRLLNSPQKKT